MPEQDCFQVALLCTEQPRGGAAVTKQSGMLVLPEQVFLPAEPLQGHFQPQTKHSTCLWTNPQALNMWRMNIANIAQSTEQ